ncbi:hypothetical protein ACTJIJ_22835 [Niabella sp. 22666]|uniref:hypothetical protein n=1 Tax=Niabella sp. 22666 TaxID=3453954 RepID=UPI003F87413A
MKQETLTQTISQETIKQQMCELLGWDEMRYVEYLLHNGRQYLRFLLPESSQLKEKLERSRMFWNWFKNMFRQMDMAILDGGGFAKLNLNNRIALFDAVHCPIAVASERKPPRCVMDDIMRAHGTDWRDTLIKSIQQL